MTMTCAVTGEESDQKHYILRTTDGEELVSPDALLNPLKFLIIAARDLEELRGRIERLEHLLTGQEEGSKVARATKEAAAPVKKTAAKKTAAAIPEQLQGD